MEEMAEAVRQPCSCRRSWRSARRARDENADWEVGHEAGIGFDADVAELIRRISGLYFVEDNHAAPHQTEVGRGQLGARHWPAIIVVAAFFRVPGVSSSGATDHHQRRRQQTNKLRHHRPSNLPDPELQIEGDCRRRRNAKSRSLLEIR